MGLREKGQRRNQRVPGLAQTQAMRHHGGWGGTIVREWLLGVGSGSWQSQGNSWEQRWWQLKQRSYFRTARYASKSALGFVNMRGPTELEGILLSLIWKRASLLCLGGESSHTTRVPFSAYRSYWDPAARPLGRPFWLQWFFFLKILLWKISNIQDSWKHFPVNIGMIPPGFYHDHFTVSHQSIHPSLYSSILHLSLGAFQSKL